MNFLLPDTFVLICVIIIMFFFLVRAIFARILSRTATNYNPYDDFLFASKELTVRDIRESTAATYSTFATVFFWFVALGGIYSWLLFLIPLSLYFGNSLFTKYIQKSELQIKDYSTISSLLRAKSKFKPLHYISDLIIVVFLFSVVLVEIVIGSGILTSLVPNIPGGKLFFIILLSIIVICYVIVGGFRTVILSDTVQLYLTFAGVFALLIFATLYLHDPQPTKSFLFSPKITTPSLIAFVVSVIVVQIFGPLCQLQNWQRISSSTEQKSALQGHRQGALLGAFLWALMVLAALILFVKLQGSVSFNSIFVNMKNGGILSSYGLYPLLIVGFIAAMISTADSAMAALYLFFYDSIKRRKERQELTFYPTMRHHLLIGLIFFVIIVLVYLINQTNIQSLVISIIYFLFNQLLVLFPVLLFFILKDKILKNRKGSNINADEHIKIEMNMALSLILGWLTVFVMTAIGFFYESLNWIMFASGSGVSVSFALMTPTWKKLILMRSQ